MGGVSAIVAINTLALCLNSKIYSLQMIRLILHPCFHGILMPMCLLRTLLHIQHAYALEYDKPWLIQHYIQIYNMLMFRFIWLCCTPPFFMRFSKHIWFFFADSKYVNFNKNTYIFLLFSYLSFVITPQLKKHTGSVFSISLSFLNYLKKNCTMH